MQYQVHTLRSSSCCCSDYFLCSFKDAEVECLFAYATKGIFVTKVGTLEEFVFVRANT